MSHKSISKIVVGSNGENPMLCFSVKPGTGTSGTHKQFIDIEVTTQQLQDLGEGIKTYQENLSQE